jgi:predicted dehydrogenase
LPASLKVGLVGFGSWGRKHYRVLRRNRRISLAGIYDPKFSGKQFSSSLSDLIKRVDALDIVVPAEHLASTAKKAIKAGKHVFIEKPMATSLAEAEDLRRCYASSRVVAMVGFIERFNPVFRVLRSLFRVERPKTVFCQRSGTPTLVAKRTGVLKDLAIHDIDLLQWLLGPPKFISVIANDSFHFSQVELDFDGTKALIIADCLGPKIRRWVVELSGKVIHAHFQKTNWSLFVDNVKIPIITWEPLKRELDYFVACVLNGLTPSPTVDDGVKAIEIIEKGLKGETLTPSIKGNLSL